MLESLIQKIEELTAERFDCVTVSVADLTKLIEAAKLLCDVHEMADAGELDGIDLEWMVKTDAIILGELNCGP